jgi:hypothetical protein
VQEMNEQFEKHKWIFEPDGSLLDIYVKDTTLDDWLTLIDFLNASHKLKYVTTLEGENTEKINKDYIQKLLTDTSGELERRAVSIYFETLILNSFFLADAIKFDADPREFKGQREFETIIEFMKVISKLLNKEIILTAEGYPDYPLITMNSKSNWLKITTEEELKELVKNSR